MLFNTAVNSATVALTKCCSSSPFLQLFSFHVFYFPDVLVRCFYSKNIKYLLLHLKNKKQKKQESKNKQKTKQNKTKNPKKSNKQKRNKQQQQQQQNKDNWVHLCSCVDWRLKKVTSFQIVFGLQYHWKRKNLGSLQKIYPDPSDPACKFLSAPFKKITVQKSIENVLFYYVALNL